MTTGRINQVAIFGARQC